MSKSPDAELILDVTVL